MEIKEDSSSKANAEEKKDMEINHEEQFMEIEVYKAAVNGTILSDDHSLLKKNRQNNNVIHIAVRNERLEFLKDVANRYPELICETNCDGNNPLHLAAITGNLTIMELLVNSYKEKVDNVKQLSVSGKPWRAQNEEGNTPLHVALTYGNIKVASFLVKEDGTQLAHIRNKLKETPLHLAVQYHVDDDRIEALSKAAKLVVSKLDIATPFTLEHYCSLEKDSLSVIKLLLQKGCLAACCCDTQGLTPLLKAAMLNPPYFPAIKAIIEYCPESVELCDGSGRTLLHHINKLPSYLDYESLVYENPEVKALKNNRDNEGNTPLHIALKNKNIEMFIILILLRVNLAIRDKEGVSAADLIIQLQSDDDFWINLSNVFEEQESTSALIKDLNTNQTFSEDEENAISLMDIKFLNKRIQQLGSSFFLKRSDYTGLNILHIVDWELYQSFDEDQKEFIQQTVEAWPFLLFQTDSLHQTPFHHIAMDAEVFDKQLLDNFVKMKTEASTLEQLCNYPPWKVADYEGNSPVHTAMDFKPTPGRTLKWAREMLEYDPELGIQVNNNGKTPLHVLARTLTDECMDETLMDNVRSIIRNSKDAIKKVDNHGLTPLLLSAKRKNLLFLKLLLQSGFEFDYSILDSQGNSLWHLLAYMQLNEEYENILKQVMNEQRWEFIQMMEQLNKDGNSSLHIAIKENNFQLALLFYQFARLVFLDITKLVDNDGNTILHLAVEKSSSPFAHDFIKNICSWERRILMVQNKELNAPLHLAAIQNDPILANIIFDANNVLLEDMSESVQCFEDMICMLNKEKNSPLHLAILQGNNDFVNKVFDRFESIRPESVSRILVTCDKDKNTPLHLAILEGRVSTFADMIINLSKSAAQYFEDIMCVLNEEENSPLHLAILQGNNDFVNKVFESIGPESVSKILVTCDKDHNTPLHLALKKRDFLLAKKLIEKAKTGSCIDQVLNIRNKNDDTPGGLIGSEKHLTKEFEVFCWEKPEVVRAMMGIRSSSGVSTEMIKDYTNTLGVTAALLATITFTAAFTVPGGLNSSNGSPLLMRNPAFQVFMVLDIFAMCFSMMVLFFLLWIMTIGNKRHQRMLLDITVYLLEAAFYATLLTFMMGLYVTVFPVISWIAVLACVLCSSLVLLMHKRLIISIIPWFVKFKRGYSCTNQENNVEGSKDSTQANIDQVDSASQSIPVENQDSNQANEAEGEDQIVVEMPHE